MAVFARAARAPARAIAAALVALAVTGCVLLVNAATPNPGAKPPGGGLGGVSAGTPPAPASSPATAAAGFEAAQVATPAKRYLTALHSVDYSRGFPGWKPSDFDGILTAELLSRQQQRNAAAAGPTSAADAQEWARIASTHRVVTVAVDGYRVDSQPDGSFYVSMSWHLNYQQDGWDGAGGSMFTVVTVVNLDGRYLAASERMPQAP